MSTVEIKLNDVDITADVIYRDAKFISQANGATGSCEFRVRDLQHIYHTIQIGDEITLDIDGSRQWGGYVMQLKRGYFFEATDCECPDAVPIYYQVIGSDYNILLNKRYLFDPDDPARMELEEFPAGTPDDEVIKFYCENYLDLTGDGIDVTSRVDHVGTPSIDFPISMNAGFTWNQFMTFIAYNTGSIWYITPNKKLVYCDVDTENAPFEISDQPGSGQVGVREYTVLFDGSRLRNDALVWGAGKGNDDLVFARNTATTSVNVHGLWQVGKVVGGAWKQETVDRTAATYVDGSPQSQRGGKIDRHSVDAILFEPGLRVAHKVHAYSEVFDFDEVIPVRVLAITFPASQTEPQYQITLAHEIDEPQDLTDPFPPTLQPPTVCSIIHCGPFEDVSVPETGVGGSGIQGPSPDTSLGIDIQEGGNSHHVAVSHLCQPNNWYWTNDPTFTQGASDGAQVYTQWSDIYGYTTIPPVLCQKGDIGYEISTDTTAFKVPSADENNVVYDQWYGIARIKFTVHAWGNPRPWDATRTLFPFTNWTEHPVTNDQVLAFGAVDVDQYEVQNEAIWPSKIVTTEGTFQFRDDGTSLFGERWAGYVTPETEYEISVPLGLWNAGANGILYEYFPLVDYGWAAGRVWMEAPALTSIYPIDDFPENQVFIDWYPAPQSGVIVRPPEDYPDCEPHCITLGQNCEQAERIGRRSYRVLGRYEESSTNIHVNGIYQQLDVDYTESDPDNGVVTFTEDVDDEAYVFICYTAYSIANQIPAIDPTDNIFIVPVIANNVTGTFGPQPDFWPAEVWHGIYYPHFHNGVDFGVPTGTPVYAAANGRVTWETQEAGGTMIHIWHDYPDTPFPMRTTYAHLSSRVVAPGTVVSQGDHIAYSGASGNVTGAHLHWGLVYYGWPEDPLPWSTTPRNEIDLNVP